MKKVLLFSFLLFTFTVNSQDNLWKEVSKSQLKSKSKKVKPSKYKVYKLDLQSLKEELRKVPKQRKNINLSTVILSFPDENGILKKYKIAEASVMDAQLQENHPTIKSYIGKSVDNSNSIIRFSISPYVGFNGIILNNSIPSTLIEREGNYYQIFSERDTPAEENPFKCGVIDQVESKNKNNSLKKKTLIGGKLRTYRLAMATTGEYSQYVLNELSISNTVSDTDKKNAILSYLNSIMTSVNAVFERDIAVTMQLVANNTDIIFLDPATDNLDNNSSTSSLNKNQKVCDSIIGDSNYDIGHLLITGGGGRASFNSVCSGWSKARAVSSSTSLRYYDILLHEMGHQFNARHTFNSIGFGNQLSPTTAVEIGRGRTIMSYGRSSERLFYHSVSIEQMRNFVQNGGNCASITNTGNTPPTANAGNDYIIPKSTPFLLEGTANDPDSSNLTYTWEQVDPEEGILPPVSTAIRGPVFGWLLPTTEPKRYMPNISTIIDGETAYNRENQGTWEVVPSVSRELNFIFLVRDNDIRGGETSADQMKVTVDKNYGPFLITSDNSRTTWYSGLIRTVFWDVANTNTGTVNTPTVDILFSTDGGLTYPTTLASDITNDGSYSFKIPSNIITTQGRFMIKGHNNIFLDINNADIIVEEKEFLVDISDAKKSLCLVTSNSISYSFTYNSYSGFDGTVNFSASGLNGASIIFSPASTNTDGANITMTISNISSTNIGSNTISITASSSSISHTNQVILNVFDDSLNTVSLTNPSDGAINFLVPSTFQWNAENGAGSYRIEISTDNSFSNIVNSETLTSNSFFLTSLNYSTTYYWRVKPINTCVDRTFSTTFSFTTQSEHLNDTYIPDSNFEQALIDLKLDSGELDNYVPTANIKTVRGLELGYLGITDLTGIEGFTSLYLLNCSGNQLTSLNVSANTTLTSLRCYSNKLTSLDVSKNTALMKLSCGGNQLTSLNVSANTTLTSLRCYSNKLTSLDVSKNTALTQLWCDNNQLTSLDVSENTALTWLSCNSNQLTSLDVSKNTALTQLWCDNNQLTSLDVSENTALTWLSCNSNQLTSLDVSVNTYLTELYCYFNQLTNLDVSGATALTYLNCGSNQLTSLDVSANTNLIYLHCENNKLISLDFTANLIYLGCDSNKLTSLDFSSNTALTGLHCSHNQLISLNLKNGNNTIIGLSSQISTNSTISPAIRFTNNPNLTCIQVDNVSYSTTNWPNVDSPFSFSKDCYDNTDIDNDGVLYINDDCPNTPTGESVNENGCSISQVDTDNDGVSDNIDTCPNTPTGESVNENGCSISQVDTDNDGVFDNIDTCPNTPSGESVNKNGCSISQVDTDNDGVFDNIDTCPNTPSGESVNENGCSISQIDTDSDGVFDNIDTCPNTPTGESVNENGCSESQIVYIPDDNFEQALIDLKLDSGDLDNYVTIANIKNVTYLYLRDLGITDLTGIEDFTALTTLYCFSNQLTSLDVSKNTALTKLYCSGNQLTELNVSSNTALTSLGCSNNQLTELDVSANTALTGLFCGDNKLTSLDVSENTALIELYCPSNQLTELNVSANTALIQLWCDNNQLTSLDVSENTALTWLSCNSNQLTSLDVSANTYLTELYCYSNQLTSLDVSANTALKILYCGGNQLTSLDVSVNTALTRLYCYRNQLTSLDISTNTALTNLRCFSNKLTSLDISTNTALTNLRCYSNKLTSLDVSENTALTYLDCGSNKLTSLDVSENTALTVLWCVNNSLTNLDVSANTALTSLLCYHNQLTELNVSANTALTSLHIQNNNLTFLNLKNGNNINFIRWNSVADSFNATGNPNLRCIQVDDASYSENNWPNKGTTATFNEDCSSVDTDGDGISDNIDKCPNTPTGETVNENGCSISQVDTDNDGVFDNIDTCPNTPSGESVNENGCSISQVDTDSDGVFDNIDTCPNTPSGESVNENGCSISQIDTDSDGVFDNIDTCPNTPTNETANASGCSPSQVDTDSDGVFDNIDQCPNTPTGETVNENGCSISQIDTDGDGVFDNIDTCPNTPSGETANAIGCSPSQVDTDSDGVFDNIDTCPNTPTGETVNENGCSISQIDTDSDGVFDNIDTCPNTPSGETANAIGCSPSQVDTDSDGVFDNIDQCPNTPTGETVNENGCSISQIDTDGDGVFDNIDTCPNTPSGETANAIGCSPSQVDTDSDGVFDNIDQCNSTPSGTTINAVGCIQLSSGNFEIFSTTPKCPNVNNGKISIKNLSEWRFNFVVTGPNSYNNTFENKLANQPFVIEDLAVGTYNIIAKFSTTGTGQDITGFQITINATTPVSGANKSIDIVGKSSVFTVSGDKKYSIYINDVFQRFETFSDEGQYEITVNNLSVGENHIKIIPENKCRGLIEGWITIPNSNVKFYPNPAVDLFHIGGLESSDITVQIFAYNGQLVYSKNHKSVNGIVYFSIRDLPAGLYIIRVFGKKAGDNINFKITKR